MNQNTIFLMFGCEQAEGWLTTLATVEDIKKGKIILAEFHTLWKHHASLKVVLNLKLVNTLWLKTAHITLLNLNMWWITEY